MCSKRRVLYTHFIMELIFEATRGREYYEIKLQK